MVPDLGFGGMDHLCFQMLQHKSTLYVIFADFQLPCVIGSTSRIWSYLEDVGGS